MKRIGIDLDGTVTDYMSGAIPLLAEHYGLTPNYEIKAHRIDEVFGLTKETRPPDMREVLYIKERLFSKIPKLEEDNNLLTWKLKEQLGPDVKIYFVTARDNHPIIVEDTRKWLNRNTEYYDAIFHRGDKAAFCKSVEIQVMIEDEVAQVIDLLEAGIDVIMRDQPWNQHLIDSFHEPGEGKGRLTRVFNWREMVTVAKEYYS